MIEPVGSDDWSKIRTVKLARQQVMIPHPDGVVYYKTAYWGMLTVGNPGVAFKVVFDTGSGHLVLPSSYCHTPSCKVHKRYRRSSSKSAKDIDFDGQLVVPGEPRDHISVSFGTGEVTGVFLEEDVCIGARTEKRGQSTAGREGKASLQDDVLPEGCMRMRMIAATEMSDDPFREFMFDGVLGLGLPGLSEAPEFNFGHVVAASAARAGAKRPHMFAVFLADHKEESSEITLGGFSEERVEDDLAWNPVYMPEIGQWMLEVKSVRVDNTPVDFCNEGCRAIVDTGTSLIAVPSVVLPELFELLMHPASDTMDCKGPGPTLHIELEGLTLRLEPQDYGHVTSTRSVWKDAKANTIPFLSGSSAKRDDDGEFSNMCKAMLMSMDIPEPLGPKLLVLGEPVLRRYYTVYESGAVPRVGFSHARHVERTSPDRAR